MCVAFGNVGCGAGSSVKHETAVAAGEAVAETQAADTAGEEALGGLTDPAVPQEAETEARSENGTGAEQPVSRKLIRTVELRAEKEMFDQTLQTITDQIASLGGYTEQSEITGNSLNSRGEAILRYAALTARIPSQRLDAFISGVEAAGNVTNHSETTQDVTLQYSDIQSRKKTLEVEQERIWALLEKADTLDAVITL